MEDSTQFRVCSVDGCDRKYHCRGWCEMHHSRWRKHGDVFADVPPILRRKGTVEEGFREKYRVDPDTGCWLWTRALNQKGYGNFHDGQRVVGAHRFSYELHKGPIPPGMFVCHSCDTPACCNPDHLWLGTCADNMLDASVKNRTPRGTRHPRALPQDLVDLIRDMWRNGATQKEIAATVGCSTSTAWRIANGARHRDTVPSWDFDKFKEGRRL